MGRLRVAAAVGSVVSLVVSAFEAGPAAQFRAELDDQLFAAVGEGEAFAIGGGFVRSEAFDKEVGGGGPQRPRDPTKRVFRMLGVELVGDIGDKVGSDDVAVAAFGPLVGAADRLRSVSGESACAGLCASHGRARGVHGFAFGPAAASALAERGNESIFAFVEMTGHAHTIAAAASSTASDQAAASMVASAAGTPSMHKLLLYSIYGPGFESKSRFFGVA